MIDDLGNRKKGQPLVEEGGDGDFVCGIENGRRDASVHHRLASKAEKGEARFLYGPKIQGKDPLEIEGRIDAANTPVGEQGTLNGKRHRRGTQLCDHHAIEKLHQAMHNALRMDNGIALSGP